jgi:GMP synthase (glutamine-hydrolysing)
MIDRHPFPVRACDKNFRRSNRRKGTVVAGSGLLICESFEENNFYATVWQAGAILLPVKSVGVMGDERTYEFTLH